MSNININGKTAVHQKSNGKLMTTDVCMTPPFCVPIPYSNIAESKMTDMGASSVKVQGSPTCNAKSNFKISQGDAPGACAGVSSGSIGQMAEFITFSNDVMIEGKPAVRNDDKMVSNLKNTAPQPLMQPPAGNAPAGKSTVPKALEGDFSQQLDVGKMIFYDPELVGSYYEIWTKGEDGRLLAKGRIKDTATSERVFTNQSEELEIIIGENEWLSYTHIESDIDSDDYQDKEAV